jgi:2-dehydropantoate 2-reductase
LMRDPPTRTLIRNIMLEVIAMAAADGYPIDQGFADHLLAFTDGMEPYLTSMQCDRAAGRPMELEPILGDPIRAARARNCEPRLVCDLYNSLVQVDRHSSER